MKCSLEEFIERVARKKDADLSTAEDMSIAVMNLISLEEHFFFTGVKTGKDEHFDTAQEVRGLRKELLAQLMPRHEGESWCIAKHLLAATMRLMEVGNKRRSEGKRDESRMAFAQAYKVYTIFWALKLSLIEGGAVQKAAQQSSTLEDLVSKLANCCDE